MHLARCCCGTRVRKPHAQTVLARSHRVRRMSARDARKSDTLALQQCAKGSDPLTHPPRKFCPVPLSCALRCIIMMSIHIGCFEGKFARTWSRSFRRVARSSSTGKLPRVSITCPCWLLALPLPHVPVSSFKSRLRASLRFSSCACPFAVFDADVDAGSVDICYQVVGDGTEQLTHVGIGDEVDLVGPHR